MDSQARALNDDVRQLNSIHKWLERKEHRLASIERDIDMAYNIDHMSPSSLFDNGRAIATLERNWADYIAGDDQPPELLQQQHMIQPPPQHVPYASVPTYNGTLAPSQPNYDIISPTAAAAVQPATVPTAVVVPATAANPLDITPHHDVTSRISVMQGMIRRWAGERIGLRG